MNKKVFKGFLGIFLYGLVVGGLGHFKSFSYYVITLVPAITLIVLLLKYDYFSSFVQNKDGDSSLIIMIVFGFLFTVAVVYGDKLMTFLSNMV